MSTERVSTGSTNGSTNGQARAFVVAAIVLLALNLRPAAVSVGPVLDEIRDGLGMSGTEAGLLTSLPVLAFAVFGALAPRLAGAVGPHRLVTLALGCVTVGLVARSRVDGVPAFLGLSLLALAGMATANVVLPSLVKRHFPDRVGLMTAVYSTGLAVGLTGASVSTVPIAEATDGWRTGLAVWAGTALLALLPWLLLLRQDGGRRDSDDVAPSRPPLGAVLRTPVGRRMALFFGLQSMQAYAIFGWFAAVYRDAGFSGSTAGLLLGVVTGTSIPLSFLVPWLAGRMTDVRPLVLALGACYPVGYVGLVLAPHDGAVLWAVVIGVATCTFPLALTLIGLRARTAEGTAALSASTQATGYLLAALGPFGFGLLHDLTGGWTAPLLVMTALSVPLVLTGLALAEPVRVEDQLDRLRAPVRG